MNGGNCRELGKRTINTITYRLNMSCAQAQLLQWLYMAEERFATVTLKYQDTDDQEVDCGLKGALLNICSLTQGP